MLQLLRNRSAVSLRTNDYKRPRLSFKFVGGVRGFFLLPVAFSSTAGHNLPLLRAVPPARWQWRQKVCGVASIALETVMGGAQPLVYRGGRAPPN